MTFDPILTSTYEDLVIKKHFLNVFQTYNY